VSQEQVYYNPGDRIGNYVVRDILGKGGMGAVYRAEHFFLKRQVALKMVCSRSAQAEHFKNIYMREAALLGSLQHPNILPIHDVGEHEGNIYYTMDLLKGTTLKDMQAWEKRPPLPTLLKIMAQIAGAVHHAHERDIIHRDIKPQNICVSPSGEPVLTDFGVAVRPSDIGEKPALCGTPGYMAPEMAHGGAHFDHRVDVFSLGASLYDIVAGRPPYPAKDLTECLRQAASMDPVDMTPLAGKAPEYVIDIVARCLKKNPHERYQSADDIKKALEAAIDHMEMSESTSAQVTPPHEGQRLLLHVEYEEAELPGSFREYDIGPYVGGGQFGDVYRARERLSGKAVALKILKQAWVSNADAVARFRREATLLSRLSHPNIVRLYNFGRYGPTFFFAMELLEGLNLQEMMRLRGALRPGVAASLVAPVLRGLGAVHEAGAIHRDMKPSNVVLAGSRVVVCDFGVAKAAGMQTLTLSGGFLGTPAYAAPEQLRGDEATAASDVYSAGVVLYELLSAKRPHEDELADKMHSRPAVPIEAHCRGVPRDMADLLQSMLDDDPARRPSAPEAAGTIEKFVTPEIPTLVSPPDSTR
jgi:serine/threonine-protein kinase